MPLSAAALDALWREYGAAPSPALRNRLAEQYMSLVDRIVAGFALRLPRHVSRDDLESDAALGLLAAIPGYDPARGATFEVFAALRIRGEILDGLRRRDTRKGRKAKRVVFRSLSDTVYENDGRRDTARADLIPDPSAPDPLAALLRASMVDGFLKAMSKREREIVRAFYFDHVPATEIARRLDLTTPYVYQIMQRAFACLNPDDVAECRALLCG